MATMKRETTKQITGAGRFDVLCDMPEPPAVMETSGTTDAATNNAARAGSTPRCDDDAKKTLKVRQKKEAERTRRRARHHSEELNASSVSFQKLLDAKKAADAASAWIERIGQWAAEAKAKADLKAASEARRLADLDAGLAELARYDAAQQAAVAAERKA